MPRVVIINQPLHNRGDQAAHRALIQLLHEQGNIDVTVLSIDSHEAVQDFSEGICGVEYRTFEPFNGRMQKYFRFVMCKPKFLIKLLQMTPKIRRYNEVLKQADYVLCSPGGICMGGYKNWVHIWNLANAIALNKKTGIYGRSIGPFSDKKKSEKMFKQRSVEILKVVDYLSLRDGYSQQLVKDMGIPCVATIDTAFAVIPQATIPQELSFLKQYKYAVFVPNQLNRWHPAFKDIPQDAFDNLYKTVIRDIVNREYQVVMLPQLFGYSKADRIYFQELAKEFDPEKIIVISDTYNSDIQQKIIERSSFLVGARYHSVIFAINNQTPFLCLSYEHKMEDTLKLLGLERYSMRIDELIRYKDSIDIISKQIDRLCDERDPIRNEISAAGAKAEKIARDAFAAFIVRLNATAGVK